jgi:Flp pilus assembly protein TadD
MGDIATATKYFDLGEQLLTPGTNSAKCQNLINRGLIALGNNQFVDAHQLFKSAVDLDGSNVTAVNNMAVCLLYLGKLGGALQSLETLVYSNPQRNIQETTVLNLCTLYELESSKAQRKKQKLLSLIGQHRGNGFNVGCLKMT